MLVERDKLADESTETGKKRYPSITISGLDINEMSRTQRPVGEERPRLQPPQANAEQLS